MKSKEPNFIGLIAVLILFVMGFANAAVNAQDYFDGGVALTQAKANPVSVNPQKQDPGKLVSSIRTIAYLASETLSEAERALAGMVKQVNETASGSELSHGHTSMTRFEPADDVVSMRDRLGLFEQNLAVFIKLTDQIVDLLEMYEKANRVKLSGTAHPVIVRALLFRVKAIVQNLAAAKSAHREGFSPQDFLVFSNGPELKRFCGSEGCFERPKAGIFGNKSVRKTLLQSDPMNQLKTVVAYLSQNNLEEILKRDAYQEKHIKTVERPTGRIPWKGHCQPLN